MGRSICHCLCEMQRNPMWFMLASIICGCRAAGRFRYQLVLDIVGPLHLNRQARHQNSKTHFFLACFQQSLNLVHFSGRRENHNQIAQVLSLQRHGGAASFIDFSLHVLCGSDLADQKQCGESQAQWQCASCSVASHLKNLLHIFRYSLANPGLATQKIICRR